MKVEIDTDGFDFAYENRAFIKMSGHFWKLCNGQDDGLDGKQLLEDSYKESALNEFRLRAFKFYTGNK